MKPRLFESPTESESIPSEDHTDLDTPVFFEHDGTQHAVRRDEWKLVTDTATDRCELYRGPHMSDDGEDVLADHSELATELQELLTDHVASDTAATTGRKGHEGLRDSVEANLEDLGYLE